MIDFKALAAPFPADRISWRVGSTNKDKSRGMALAYFDARDAMARLDEVCGPGGWQCKYPHAGAKTVCEIGIKIYPEITTEKSINEDIHEWVWKADGAGDTDFEAEKGALSDAFKRAAVRWGIGRYLYDVDAPWVAIEPHGKSFKIVDSEMPKLHALLSRRAPAQPNGATRPPPPKPAEGPPPVNTGGAAPNDWAIVAQDIERVIKSKRSDADITEALKEHARALNGMKIHDPDRYNALGAMVKGCRTALAPVAG